MVSTDAILLHEISKILTYTADPQLLTRRVGNYIASSLKAEKVAFCIPEKGNLWSNWSAALVGC